MILIKSALWVLRKGRTPEYRNLLIFVPPDQNCL